MRDELVTECLCHRSADKIRMPAARQCGTWSDSLPSAHVRGTR